MFDTVSPRRIAFVSLVTLSAFALASSAFGDEVKSLRGKPSKEQILEALTPSSTPPTGTYRTRGLSLGGDAAKSAPSQDAAPAAAVAAKPEKRALDLDIRFEFNSDQLTNDGKDVLDQLGEALKSPELASAKGIMLEGHADAKGSAIYNKLLSLKRAQTAKNYLASKQNVPAGKLKAVGKGSTEPIDPSNPEDPVNRRVRVIVDG
jgi:outer membrane protein OmpA-like peptidoglycan-associated protein